jgi:hypothetical protein
LDCNQGRGKIDLVGELIKLIHGLLVDILELAQFLRNFHQRIVEIFLCFIPVSAKRREAQKRRRGQNGKRGRAGNNGNSWIKEECE